MRVWNAWADEHWNLVALAFNAFTVRGRARAGRGGGDASAL